jgi:predicted patatin/cPLA2 family phospholipase
MGDICYNSLEVLVQRRRDIERYGHIRDNAKIMLVYQGGCLRTAFSAGLVRGIDDAFGIGQGNQKSILPMVDGVVVISGGAAVFLAQANGLLQHSDDIFNILASKQFINIRRLVARELCKATGEYIGSKEPAVNLRYAIDALNRMGVDASKPARTGIDTTYTMTEHASGAAHYVHNPQDAAAANAAFEATMKITGLAGGPMEINGTLLRDGGHSNDPVGVQFALDNADHVLFFGNLNPSHVGPDAKLTRGCVWSELSGLPAAWRAYEQTHLLQSQFHAAARDITDKPIMSDGIIFNSDRKPVRVQSLFPAPDYRLSAIELDSNKLREGIRKGEEVARQIAKHIFDKMALADYSRAVIHAQSAQLDAFFAFSNAAREAFFAVPLAATRMGMAATKTTLAVANASIRHLPWMGGSNEPPASTP